MKCPTPSHGDGFRPVTRASAQKILWTNPGAYGPSPGHGLRSRVLIFSPTLLCLIRWSLLRPPFVRSVYTSTFDGAQPF